MRYVVNVSKLCWLASLSQLGVTFIGFCTPGIIVSIYTLLACNASVPYIEEHLDGNLCRCTGYRSIWDAARSLCDDGDTVVRGPCGVPCRECPERDDCKQECNLEEVVRTSSKDKMQHYTDTFLADKTWRDQPNSMFPSELMDANSEVSTNLSKPMVVVDQSDLSAGGTWFKPTTFNDLLSLMREFGGKIVIGNTEVGIETKFKHAVFPRLISPSDSIAELFGISKSESQVIIGSCCSLSVIQHYCGELAESHPAWSRTVMPFHDMLRWFASTQIRNVACLGGNLVTASPISDMNPMLAAAGANLVLASIDASGAVCRRSVAVSDFFVKYRTVDLGPSEVVERVEVPILRPVLEYFQPFKQARRREDDISIVTSGMRLRLGVSAGKFVIEDAHLAFGGMAIKTVMTAQTASCLIGSEFSLHTFQLAIDVLMKELSLPEGVPGGQAAFRMTLASSFLYKFFLLCVEELKADVEVILANPSAYPDLPADLPPVPQVSPEEASGKWSFVSGKKPEFTGEQVFPAPKVAKGYEDVVLPKDVETPPSAKAAEVGKPVTHASGPLHCTGEALYADDIPVPSTALEAVLVLTDQCGCTFDSVDTLPALQVPGVYAVYTYEDIVRIGGKNEFGPVIEDEVVFLPPGTKILNVGQVVGVVVAESIEKAELGARSCVVKYGSAVEKVVLSIEEAIQANSFYEMAIHDLARGDANILDSLSEMPDTSGEPKVGDTIKVSGSFRCGNQEHFYLETQSTLVVPSDADTNLTIYCSTQAATKTQKYSALATGTHASKVVVRVKRLGGGFGGKETRTVFSSLAAAVAAKISGRPVRLTLGRDLDMKLSGNRHAFLANYSASALLTDEGPKLVAFDVKLYSNCGFALDLSGPVMDRALFHVDGCYFFPHFRAKVSIVAEAFFSHRPFPSSILNSCLTTFFYRDFLAVQARLRTQLSVDSEHPKEWLLWNTSWIIWLWHVVLLRRKLGNATSIRSAMKHLLVW